VLEEGLVHNIIDVIQRQLLEKRKEFKAVIARLRAETSKVFALPGELRRFETYKSSTFEPLVVVREDDEYDESRDDLYRTLEADEEKWFRDQEEPPKSGLRERLEEFEREKGLSKRSTEVATYRTMKHTYIKSQPSHRSLSQVSADKPSLEELKATRPKRRALEH
jgi:hypothetical protein